MVPFCRSCAGRGIASGEGPQHEGHQIFLSSHSYFLNQYVSSLCRLDGIFSGRHHSTITACCHLPAVPYCTRSPYWLLRADLDVLSTPCPKATQANLPGRQEEFYLPKKWKLIARTSFRGCLWTLVLRVWTVPGRREDAFWLHSITSRFILRVIGGSCFPLVRPSLPWFICYHVGPPKSGNLVFLWDKILILILLYPSLPPDPAT